MISRYDTQKSSNWEKKLKESGKIFRKIFENLPNPVAILDKSGVFIEANPAMVKNLGINPTGKNLYDVLPEEIAEREMEYLKKVMRENKKVSFKNMRDDREFFTTLLPIKLNEGSYCVVIEREITGTIRINRLLKVINGINKLMVYEKDPKVLLDKACKLLFSLRDYYSVWIGLKKEKDVELVSYCGGSGLHPEKLKDPRCIWFAERKARMVKLTPEMRKNICPYHSSHKDLYCMIFPMIVEDSVIGFIIIHSQRKVPVGEGQLLQTLANDLAFALRANESEKAKIRAYRQIEENIENYAILVDQIRNNLSIISGIAELKVEDEEAREILLKEVTRIEEVIKRLDKGWLGSEKIRKFLKMDDVRREIEEIIKELDCPKDFRCYKTGFKDLCKAKNTDTFLECLEKEGEKCPFSVFYGYSYFCRCPIRMYLAKKLSL
jgi:two-component system response regulator